MEQQMEVFIRPARKEDAAVIAQCVLMAIPVEALTGMGRGISEENLVRVLETVAQMDEAIYGWRNVLVAEVSGVAGDVLPSVDNTSDCTQGNAERKKGCQVVGAIIAYDGARLHELRRPLEDLLERYVGPEAHDWDDETSAGEFYIDTLAVNPECRGMNIGSRLIEATCRKAAELGHAKIGLLVDLENPRAEKLYSHLGFKTVGLTPFMQHTYKHMQREP